VPSFSLPSGFDIQQAGDREQLADDYVDRLVKAGIDVAAITDYQGVRTTWFTLIRDRARTAGITVLPGAEMSIRRGGGKGLHLLLVCDPDTQPERIATVIRHQHDSPDPLYPDEVRAGHGDVDLRGQIHDGLRAVREQLGCVIIAAHAMENNGLLRVLGAQQAAELVRDGLIDAIDHCESAKEKLQSTGVLTKEQLASLACTLSGDPKSLAEIGTKTLSDGRRRLTWIKLSTVNADALRLALHDPQTRVLTRPPGAAHHSRVVALLRAEKGVADPARRRQIIVATHNANIPVNGDAELVLSLADEGGRCHVRARASIDDSEVRQEIRTVLEGGAEAFRRRAEKYGGLDDTR
jgi:hypothetical protein